MSAAPVGKLLLTVAEVTELTGIGRSKLYELMREGSLESVSVGRSRYVPSEALTAFVDGLRGRPAEQTGLRAVG